MSTWEVIENRSKHRKVTWYLPRTQCETGEELEIGVSSLVSCIEKS